MKGKTFGIIIIFVLAMVLSVYLYNNLAGRYTDDREIKQGETALNTAADFTVLDENGGEVRLSDFFGKPIIINFWATWCGPCTSELPVFEKAYTAFGDRVHFLMVNLTDGTRDTVDGVKAFVARNGFTFPVLYDTNYSGAYAYNVVSIPKTVAIDSQGRVIKTYTGAISESRLEAIIDDLLKR